MKKFSSVILFAVIFWSIQGYCGNEKDPVQEQKYLIQTENNIFSVDASTFKRFTGEEPTEINKTLPKNTVNYQRILDLQAQQTHANQADVRVGLNTPEFKKPQTASPLQKQAAKVVQQNENNTIIFYGLKNGKKSPQKQVALIPDSQKQASSIQDPIEPSNESTNTRFNKALNHIENTIERLQNLSLKELPDSTPKKLIPRKIEAAENEPAHPITSLFKPDFAVGNYSDTNNNPFDLNPIVNPKTSPECIIQSDVDVPSLERLFLTINEKFQKQSKIIGKLNPFHKPTRLEIREILAFVNRHQHDLKVNEYVDLGETLGGEVAPCGIQLIPSENGIDTDVVIYPKMPIYSQGGYKQMKFAIKLDKKGNHQLMAWLTPRPQSNEKQLQELEQEYKLHQTLQGPQIAALPHIAKNKYIMTQKLYETDLHQLLITKGRKPLDLEKKIDLGVNILMGLNHLYELKTIHRDLKLENILLDSAYQAYIADFGTAVRLKERDSSLTGTYNYNSPEDIINGRNDLSRKTDSWAVGTMFLELFYGNPTLRKFNGQKVHDSIKNLKTFADVDRFFGLSCQKSEPFLNNGGSVQPEIRPSHFNQSFETSIDILICGLLNPDPAHRLTTPEALKELKRIQELYRTCLPGQKCA